MATASVIEKSFRAKAMRDLTRHEVSDIERLIYQANGIAALVSAATSSDDTLPDDAVPGACWAIRDALDGIQGILSASSSNAGGDT